MIAIAPLVAVSHVRLGVSLLGLEKSIYLFTCVLPTRKDSVASRMTLNLLGVLRWNESWAWQYEAVSVGKQGICLSSAFSFSSLFTSTGSGNRCSSPLVVGTIPPRLSNSTSGCDSRCQFPCRTRRQSSASRLYMDTNSLDAPLVPHATKPLYSLKTITRQCVAEPERSSVKT